MRVYSLFILFPVLSSLRICPNYFINKAQISAASRSQLYTGNTPDDKDSFDPAEFDRMLQSMDPSFTDNFKNPNPNIISSLNNQNQENILKEELSRKFPYEDYELPILPDCNNYYSGTYGKSFW